MSAFQPETLARALMPKDLLSRSTMLHLALHLNQVELEVAVFDKDHELPVWQQHFELGTATLPWQNAFSFLEDRNWKEGVFRKVTISFDTDAFTLVPHAFMISGKEHDLLEFNLQRSVIQAETISLDSLGASLLYDFPVALSVLTEWWPNARFYPTVALMLLQGTSLRNTGKMMYAHATSASILLSVFDGAEMKLANVYPRSSNDDVLYHIANACIRLGIDLASVSVRIEGSEAGEDLHALMSTYNTDVKLNTLHFPVAAHPLCV